MNTEIEIVLNELLADGIRFDPHYLPSMNSDHLPMTLCAMAGLGGTEAQLLAFRDEYVKILRPVATATAAGELHEGQWRDLIGVTDGYAALLAYFLVQLEHRGIESLIREVLPEVIDSLALAAFHPVIRLAYGIEAGSPQEVAASLAYMVTTHRDVPADTKGTCDLEQALRVQIAAGKVVEMKSFGGSLIDLMHQNRYPGGCATDFETCAQMSLAVYQSTRNFFALHMVTATYAARICAKYMDEEQALQALTRALLGAHLVVGSPDFDVDHPAPIPERLDSPHAYKYAYICLREFQHYGDERYLAEISGFKSKGLIPQWVVT